MYEMKIYTKTGDKGETGLIGSRRVPKDDIRIEAYGTVDELNSCLGVALSFIPVSKIPLKAKTQVQSSLKKVQNELFCLGSQLANPDGKGDIPQITEKEIKDLEVWIDRMEEDLPPLRQFILPGGTSLTSFIHLCRSVCRRAERLCVKLSHKKSDQSTVIRYLNRLSDCLFVLARWVQKKSNGKEIPWKLK